VNFAPGKIPLGAKAAENVNSVPAKETDEHCAVWLTSVERRHCSNEAKKRNPLKFAGCPKLTNRSQPLVGQSSPDCGDTWGRYCCLRGFFPTVNMCISAKI